VRILSEILVSNAATLYDPPQRPWLEVDDERWRDTYQTNTLAPAMLARQLIPGMVKRGSLRELAQQKGWQGSWEEIQKRAASEAYRLTVGRMGKPDDIARAVTFLASPLSDFITGVNLRVCGGSSSEMN
jgi:NAD(P)-dependent dehydrogenase (short-subunit alcohol dehydrogenase family)